MESPPPSVHGRTTPSPKKKHRNSAIEALLSPGKEPGIVSLAAAVAVDSAVPPGGADSAGGGHSLEGVLPGMLEALAVEQQQQRSEDGSREQEGRLADVSLAGGGGQRAAQAETAGAVGVRGKGRGVGGDDALTVRVRATEGIVERLYLFTCRSMFVEVPRSRLLPRFTFGHVCFGGRNILASG